MERFESLRSYLTHELQVCAGAQKTTAVNQSYGIVGQAVSANESEGIPSSSALLLHLHTYQPAS